MIRSQSTGLFMHQSTHPNTYKTVKQFRILVLYFLFKLKKIQYKLMGFVLVCCKGCTTQQHGLMRNKVTD